MTPCLNVRHIIWKQSSLFQSCPCNYETIWWHYFSTISFSLWHSSPEGRHGCQHGDSSTISMVSVSRVLITVVWDGIRCIWSGLEGRGEGWGGKCFFCIIWRKQRGGGVSALQQAGWAMFPTQSQYNIHGLHSECPECIFYFFRNWPGSLNDFKRRKHWLS